MALTNGRGYTETPLVYLSPRSTVTENGKSVELEKPRFEVSRVNKDGKIEKTQETATSVSGDLTRIDFKEREYNGNKSRHVILYISDSTANETYFIDFTYRISTRSLFNALLSLKKTNDIELSIYRSKKGYESFGLRQAGQLISWKFPLEQLPAADVIKDKKGNVIKTDFGDVDSFFEEELRTLASNLFGGKRISVPPAVKEEAVEDQEVDGPVESKGSKASSDQDIPF
jgi:hypothetical protein